MKIISSPIALSLLVGAAAVANGCFFSLEAPPSGIIETGGSAAVGDGDGDLGDGDLGDGDLGDGDLGDGDLGDGDTSVGGSPGDGDGMGGGPFECLDGLSFFDNFEHGDDCWDPSSNSAFGIVEDGFEGRGYAQMDITPSLRIAETIGPEGGWEDVRLEARVKITDWGTDTPSSGNIGGLFVRYLDDENFYYLAIRGDDKIHLRKRLNRIDNDGIGDSHTVQSGFELDQWYEFAIEVEGTTLRMFFDGTLRGEFEDSDLATPGQVAIGAYDEAALVFDDVRVTPL